VEEPPHPPVGGLTYAQVPHVTYENFSQLLAGFWKNGWLVGESCLASRVQRLSVYVCPQRAPKARESRVETPQAPRSKSAKWYGAPVVSKYVALNIARTARC